MAEIGDGPTRWEFLPTPTRRFREFVIDVKDQAEPMALIREKLGALDLRDAIVKLIIRATPENEGQLDLREIRSYLKDANHVAAIVREV